MHFQTIFERFSICDNLGRWMISCSMDKIAVPPSWDGLEFLSVVPADVDKPGAARRKWGGIVVPYHLADAIFRGPGT